MVTTVQKKLLQTLDKVTTGYYAYVYVVTIRVTTQIEIHKMTPLEIILSEIEAVKLAFDSTGSFKNAHQTLKEKANPVGNIQFNTFKTLLPGVLGGLNCQNKTLELALTVVESLAIGYENMMMQCSNRVVTVSNDTVVTSVVTGDATSVVTSVVTDIESVVTTDESVVTNVVTDSENVVTNVVTSVVTIDNEIPKKFNDWSVNVGKDKKIRLSKRINGKPVSLYVAMNWDAAKALAKIAKFNGKDPSAQE